jgi:hypothetical protein
MTVLLTPSTIDMLYIDMDGVTNDFELKAAECVMMYFGVDMYESPKRIMWQAISKYQRLNGETFWYDLPIMEGTSEFLNMLRDAKYDFQILSAVGNKGFNANEQKYKSCLDHFNIPRDRVNLVTSSTDKASFATPKSILIDDRMKSIGPWREAGGIGILHTSWGDTITQLKTIIEI